MTTDELSELFDKHSDEFLKFDRISSLRNKRPDLHAFLLLDELVPGESDMVSASGHDEIYLEVDMGAIAAVATEDQIVELIRCGVRLSEYDCFCMFV
jgi:hypothetical protein